MFKIYWLCINKKLIEAWKNGTTGFPMIDASMRQMNKTGWMHNRSRLCVANALVYLFHTDWKIGEKYFAQKLADYDISQNNGNWQWCGGVGILETLLREWALMNTA